MALLELKEGEKKLEKKMIGLAASLLASANSNFKSMVIEGDRFTAFRTRSNPRSMARILRNEGEQFVRGSEPKATYLITLNVTYDQKKSKIGLAPRVLRIVGDRRTAKVEDPTSQLEF